MALEGNLNLEESYPEIKQEQEFENSFFWRIFALVFQFLSLAKFDDCLMTLLNNYVLIGKLKQLQTRIGPGILRAFVYSTLALLTTIVGFHFFLHSFFNAFILTRKNWQWLIIFHIFFLLMEGLLCQLSGSYDYLAIFSIGSFIGLSIIDDLLVDEWNRLNAQPN